ncbi:hypothetical protein DRQ09_10550, partial [candidate division KSB1 bacterium]
GHYFTFQLVNLKVFSESGEFFGVIKEVIENPGNDYLVVDYQENSYNIPLVKEFIKFIDFDKKEVVVRRVKEFLEL